MKYLVVDDKQTYRVVNKTNLLKLLNDISWKRLTICKQK